MPVHPAEEEAPSHITDQVAKESSNSTASSHPLHTGSENPPSITSSSQDQSSASAASITDTITQKAKEFANTASNTATSLANQAQQFIANQTGGSDKENNSTGGLTDKVASQAEGFLDGNATRGPSHSKYVQDHQNPGVTDDVAEEEGQFEKMVESGK